MVNTVYALSAYTQTKASTTTNPLELVIMLYDGAIDSLDKAAAAINMKEIPIKLKYMNKALAIIDELNNSLNIEAGGEIALNLQDLYLYMIRELVLANIKNDINGINHVNALLKELRESWGQIRDMV